MGDRFPLLEQLGNQERNPTSPLPRGIRYQQFTVIVEKEETDVFIPLKEALAFEKTLSEQDGKYLKREEFNAIMRKHRGVRNRE